MKSPLAKRVRKDCRMSDAARPHQRMAVAGVLSFSFLLLAGCSDRSRAVNAKLRDQIHVLEQQNESLQQQCLELKKKLEASVNTSASQMTASSYELHPAVPVVTTIAIDPLSGRKSDVETDEQSLEVYVQSRDGRGRPVQLAGSMLVKVTRIDENQPPRELAVINLSPEEVRESWRAGIMGSPSWLVTIPLAQEDLLPGTESLDVDVFYKDLRTGAEFQCGAKVDIR